MIVGVSGKDLPFKLLVKVAGDFHLDNILNEDDVEKYRPTVYRFPIWY